MGTGYDSKDAESPHQGVVSNQTLDQSEHSNATDYARDHGTCDRVEDSENDEDK